MTTGASLISQVRNRVNLSSADDRVSDANLLEFVNAAIQDIASQRDWPWNQHVETISVTLDDNTYTPHSLWRTTLSLTLDDPQSTLQKRTWKWTRRIASTDLKGKPAYYTEHAGTIYIFPIPDKAYTLTHRFMMLASNLGSTSNSVDSPDWFDHVIVTRAASYVAQKMRDSEMYQMLETQYKAQLKSFGDEISRSYEPTTISTRRDWEYG